MIGETVAGAIELGSLTKRYGRHTVVDDLSLSVPRGTIFGLVGPNGAGKSTTIKMLMGMLSISSGSARLLGIDVSSAPSQMKRRVGYVPETHHVYRWMRVGEALRFARAFYPTWNDDCAAMLMELFSLDPAAKVGHLSKGTAVKLSLLLAVAHEPELLVLDEPVSGLDPIVREEFLEGVLKVICRRQCTVLFSSHTLDDVQRLADSVGILCQGKLLVHQPVDDLLANTKRIRAVLHDGCLPRWEPPGTVWRHLDRRQWLLTVSDFEPGMVERLSVENQVEHVEVADLGLGDVFKDYIKGRQVTA